MEYKIFRAIRHKINIPYFIRFIFAAFFIFLSSIPILLPLFPGSLFVGVGILVVGFLLIIPGEKIRHVVKIRKGIVYLMKNLHRENVVDHKVKDIRNHIKIILQDK